MLHNSQTFKRLPAWRLWVPLVCQTALILAAPVQPFYTQIQGKTVFLLTQPVDLYDFLRGYNKKLKYDISTTDDLRLLPGWKELVKQKVGENSDSLDYLPPGTRVYVILQAPASAESSPPKPWIPVGVSGAIPASLPANQIVLNGTSAGYSIDYGLETYDIPEARRDEINSDITQTQLGKQQQSLVVEVKVNSRGDAVPISFWVGNASDGVHLRNYHF